MVLFSCLLAAACNDDDDGERTTCCYEPDRSLAGSISLINWYKMGAEGSYDGSTLDNYEYDMSSLDFDKVSDTKVRLYCLSTWGETTLAITIPEITVSGKPYDVTFDCSCGETTVIYDDVEYTSVSTAINGWIKLAEPPGVSLENDGDISRDSPATPDYNCDINIDCNVEGKMLSLKITSMSPY